MTDGIKKVVFIDFYFHSGNFDSNNRYDTPIFL